MKKSSSSEKLNYKIGALVQARRDAVDPTVIETEIELRARFYPHMDRTQIAEVVASVLAERIRLASLPFLQYYQPIGPTLPDQRNDATLRPEPAAADDERRHD